MRVEVNVTGQSYTSKSLPLSAQVTRNFYPEAQQDVRARSQQVLHSFSGLKSFGATSTTAKDRGMLTHKGVLYRVAGTELFSVSSSGAHTSLGTISGTGYCVLEGIGSNVVVVTGGRAYQYDGSTVSEITDTNLETPNSCAHLNNQMIYDGDGGRFVTSDVGDATTINGLNYATAESNADDLKRVYTFNQLLLNFGEVTMEPWYNSGVGNPPYDRVEGGIITVGIAAIYSVASNDAYVYWLGDDRQIYRTTGQDRGIAVSTIAMANEFSTYTAVSDAIGSAFTYDGQNFYMLTFPTEDKTWCFTESGAWFELSSGASGGRYRGQTIVAAYGKNIVADEITGDLYELSSATYDENGNSIIRVRDSGVFHGGMIGAPGVDVEFNRLELIMEAGVGLLSGQGVEPVIMLQVSDDGGRTWSNEMWGEVGRLGDFMFKVEWSVLGAALSRIFRIKTSDPVFYSIHSGILDVEAGI